MHASWTRPKVHPDPDFWGCCQRKGDGYWMISSHPAFSLSSVQSHSTEKRGFVIVSWDWRSKKTFTVLYLVLLLDARRYNNSSACPTLDNMKWPPSRRPTEQIQDSIANCVHSVCVFIERGIERADMEKLSDKLFWSPNPANRLHEKYTQVLCRKSAKSICWCLIHTRLEGQISICTIWCK